MKLFPLVLFVVSLFSGILSASQRTFEEDIKFDGFARLLAATDVVAIIQFEEDSPVNFQVVEVLYPKKADINNFFAAYRGTHYGMLGSDRKARFSPAIIPGGKFILFLKRLDTGGRRSLYDSRNFMMPSYASSYGLASEFHAVIPLFDFDSNDYGPMKRYRKSNSVEPAEAVTRYIALHVKRPLADAYGTFDPEQILGALRGVFEIASGGRVYPGGPVAGSLSGNIAFQNIIKDVMDGGKLKKGILEYPELPDFASEEPPARAQDSSVLRESYLNKLKIKEYKVDGVPFWKALTKLEAAIRKEPGYETVRFVVDEKLQRELKQFEPKIYIDAKDADASALVEFVADGMYVDVRKDRIVYIERL